MQRTVYNDTAKLNKAFIINFYTVLFAVIRVLFFSFLFSACDTSSTTNDHPEYFKKLLAKADELKYGDDKPRYLTFIDSAYNQFPNPGIKDMYKKYLGKYNYFLETVENDSETNVYADSMLFVLRGKENDSAYFEECSRAFFFKGNTLLKSKKYSLAIESYYQSKKLAAKIKNHQFSCTISDQIADTYYKKGKLNEALGYYKKALEEISAYSSDKGNDAFFKFVYTQANMDNIALCFTKIGQDDSAIFYFNKAFDYIQNNGSKFTLISNQRYIKAAEGIINGNLGSLYFKKGDLSTAEYLWKSSIETDTNQPDAKIDALITESKLINLYIISQKFAQAEKELQQMHTNSMAVHNTDIELRYRKGLADYYAHTGRGYEAYTYLQSYINLRDSTFAATKDQEDIDIDKEISNLELHSELEVISKKEQIRGLYITIVLFFLIMSTIVSLVIWKAFKSAKKATLLISEQKLDLEKSNQNYASVMKVMAHDLKNPLSGIFTLTCMLLESKNYKNERDSRLLNLINTASKNCTLMIDEILEADLNDHQLFIDKQFVNVTETVAQCVDIIRFKAEEKKQQIIYENRANALYAFVNREKIWRLVNNLLVNAVKFSPSGGIITVSAEKKDKDTVIISVKDHGIGIPEKYRDKIFDMFTEAKRPGTMGEQPFGLGLFICQKIVQVHNGKIWFVSENGKGSTFFVELPVGEDLLNN